MKVWLDDVREPWKHGRVGWTWVKNYDEAIELLLTGKVYEISLDHDLIYPDHYVGSPQHKDEKTGYHVILWMEENSVWPREVHVHTANPAGRGRMLLALDRYYSRCRACIPEGSEGITPVYSFFERRPPMSIDR